MAMREANIKELAEQIAWLDTDALYELAKELVENYRVPANILKADLMFVEFETID